MTWWCTILVTVVLISGHICQDFGYDGDEGPDYWGNKFEKCVGKHQSPIDIDVHIVKKVVLPKLKFNFFNKPLNLVTLENNGHTVRLSIKDGPAPSIHGGPLNGTYLFNHLHFHWGDNDTLGSENMVNHNSFPLELHMLFFNSYYKSVEEASKYSDGYVVLSFLYSTSNKPNKHYNIFETGLESIQQMNATKELGNFPSLDKFTMTDRNVYFTYEGSLTTPPCSEIVTWIEFQNTIPISHDQIDAFRQLDGVNGKLRHNYRPTQSINDRIIRMNSATTLQATFLITLSSFVIFLLNC
ncbi:putative carbonic anhydrase 3 [Aethina tumida]|uniref:putative carbonic anhydrase 3 n=1 Tax=Aethina tumida TaxID=116153 RepID=UPI0021474390|nr:putative carbonic anhydrase 3 [Aethina tumida]